VDRLEFQRRVQEAIARTDRLRDYPHTSEALVCEIMIAHDEAVEAALAEHDAGCDTTTSSFGRE
jgi:hypothetical protein